MAAQPVSSVNAHLATLIISNLLNRDRSAVRSATNLPYRCRRHHHELHRHGNEIAWWANVQIASMEIAKEFWEVALLKPDASIAAGLDGPSETEKGGGLINAIHTELAQASCVRP